MEILRKIVTVKKMEVIDGKKYLPAEKLMKSPLFEKATISFFDALNNPSPSIIAEFKRKSPSKGIINTTSRPGEVARGYIAAGVSAISVLTDREFFGGENNDLTTASGSSEVPVLRKDFIIDEYQVIEAKSIGASAILLIASILSRKESEILTRLAISLGMEVLFEIHDLSDLEKMNNNIRIIGVNNRNLNNLKVDRNNAITLLSKLPKDCLKVAESGFESPKEVKMMFSEGYDAFLIGERFMRSDDPGRSATEFIAGLK
ncbi:MAG TPA: indole-3-glycerol phosphate synthase TrpC [Bacteroidales bacterium]|nr:indole-3-glycerol phosphate synthase TrpC [Bacteroidales bacterium]